jgi:hypothetical protein
MRVPRAVIATATALLLTLALAAPAAAGAGKVPQGQGLTTLAAQGITELQCTDPTIQAQNVTFPRGGGLATWIADGRFYLAQSFHIEGTIMTPEGPVHETFTQTFGQKQGLANRGTVTCTFHTMFEENGMVGHFTGTVVLFRVW